MATVTIEEIQRDFLSYLRRVEEGETLLLTSAGRLIAEVKPAVPECDEPRPIGLAAGKIFVADDFDAPLPDEILDAFEGR